MESLGNADVVAWCLRIDDLSAEAADVLDALIGAAERKPVARFADGPDRFAAVAARALAKGLLGAATGIAPADWCLGRTAAGAPLALAPDHGPSPQVSLAHTEGAVAVAISAAPCGIDIERWPEGADGEAVARALFAPSDLMIMREATDPVEAFIRLWTIKEAVLKALGTGFAQPPDHVGILSLEPPRIGFAPNYAEARDWSVRNFAHGPFRAAAACRDGDGKAAVTLRWMRVSPAGAWLFEPEGVDPAP